MGSQLLSTTMTTLWTTMTQTTPTTTMKTKLASHQTNLPFVPTWTSAQQFTRLLRLLPSRLVSSQRWASSMRRLAGVRNKKVGRALNKLDSRWSWSNKLGDFKNGAEFWDQFCRKYSTIAKTTLLEAASKCGVF